MSRVPRQAGNSNVVVFPAARQRPTPPPKRTPGLLTVTLLLCGLAVALARAIVEVEESPPEPASWWLAVAAVVAFCWAGMVHGEGMHRRALGGYCALAAGAGLLLAVFEQVVPPLSLCGALAAIAVAFACRLRFEDRL